MSAHKFSLGVAKHLVDSTGIYFSSTPVYVLFENAIVGMSDDVSLNARLTSGALTYAGLGFAIAKGRELSQNLFHIDEDSSNTRKVVHDAGYLLTFTAVLTPAIYAYSGASLEDNITGTLIAMGLAIPIGPIIGYGIETYEDFTGLKHSKGLPTFLTQRSQSTKWSIALGGIAASVGLTALIYSLTPDNKEEKRTTDITTVVENP